MKKSRYAFPVEFQANVVRLLLSEPSFLLSYRKALDPDYFTDPELAWVAESALRIFDKVRSCPTPGSVLAAVTTDVPDGLDSDECEARARRLYRKGPPRDSAWVIERVADFGRAARVRRLLSEGPQYIERGDYDAFSKAARDATDLASDANVDVYDYARETKSRVLTYSDVITGAVPMGIPAIDQRLEGGGLGPGEMGVILALSGYHKSTMLCNIGMWARRHGLNVFHASFEISEVKTARRYDCRIAGVSLKQMLLDRVGAVAKIREFNKTHPGRLYMKRWPKRKCTVADLDTYLRGLEARTGFRPDVLVADYCANMRSESSFSGDNKRHAVAEIYGDFLALCIERGVPGWTAIQSNRAGNEKMKAEEGVLTAENCAEAYEPIRDAHLIFTLNQTQIERENNELRIYCEKNRDGEAKWIERVAIRPDRYTVTALSSEEKIAGRPLENLPHDTPKGSPPPKLPSGRPVSRPSKAPPARPGVPKGSPPAKARRVPAGSPP